MYRKPDGQLSIADFILPFEDKLSNENRWVKMAGIILWDEIEQYYAKLFATKITYIFVAKSGNALIERLYLRFTAKIDSTFVLVS